MEYIFDLDLELCSACGACAVACMDQNDIDLQSGDSPYRTVKVLERPGETNQLIFLSMACMHCKDAPCVLACPTGCITKDPETGLTTWDNSDCIGCHSCSLACPFGAPAFSQAGKMTKCHGCSVRLQNGLMPACVHTCPTNALTVMTKDEYLKKHRQKGMHEIAESITERRK